jgi:voltage-gated potassium channel
MRNLTRWLGGVLGGVLVVGLFALPYIEQAYAPDAANIKDVGDTLWYALVTLTTVGYGDYYPVSAPGQVFGAIFVLSSLGVLGLLIGKIADLFTDYRERRRLGHHGTDATGHIVLFGWNDSTARIIQQILTLDREIVVVTNDRAAIDTLHDRFSDAVFPLYAEFDDAELLNRVNLREADRALLNIDSDTDTLIHLLNLRQAFPDVEFVVAATNEELQETFRNAGVAKVVSSDANAAHLIASVIFEPDVAAFAQDLITTAEKEADHDLQQYVVKPGGRADGMAYGDLFRTLYDEHRLIPIGLSKPDGEERTLIKLPNDDVTVERGDILILIANGRTSTLLKQEWDLTQGSAS